MKVLKYTVILFSFLSFGHYAAAQTPMIEAVQAVRDANRQLNKVGGIENPCLNCIEKSYSKIYNLDKDEVVLDTPFYTKENTPYSIKIVRNSNSPKKVKLKFKNGHRVCGKMIAYSNPYNGALGIDCLFYITDYEEQVIDINFSELKKLNADESEGYEISFSKSNIDQSKYSIDINSLGNKEISFSKDNKFFDRGINLKAVEAK